MKNTVPEGIKKLQDQMEKKEKYWRDWNGRAANRAAILEAEIERLRETLTIGGNQNADLNHKNANLEVENERLQALCAEIGLRAVAMRPFIIGEQVSAFIEEFPEYKEWFNEDGSAK